MPAKIARRIYFFKLCKQRIPYLDSKYETGTFVYSDDGWELLMLKCTSFKLSLSNYIVKHDFNA